MGFVVSGGPDGEIRVESALAALHAFVSGLGQRRRATVHDEAGQPVSPAALVAEAQWRAPTPAGHRRVTAILADYVDDLVRTAPATDGNDHGTWRQAGRTWAREFGNVPHPAVLAEMRRRHPDAPVDQLSSGAWADLPRYLALATPRRGEWGVYDMTTGRLRMAYQIEDVARAHADALNTNRPWTDADRQQAFSEGMSRERSRRAAERHRWASSGDSNAPQQTPRARRRPGRQP